MSAVDSHGRKLALDSFAVVSMLMLTFSWGFNQVAIKIANTGYNPVFLTCARSLLSALLVYAWCRYRGINLFEKDGTLWPGIFAGVLFGAEFVFIFMGLDHTTAARGTLMVNTMPFWVLIGAHFFLGERMEIRKFLGLVLAFGGIVLVFSDRLSMPDASTLRGDLMCLLGGIMWAATMLVIKGSKLSSTSAEKTLMYQLVVSAAFAAPLIPVGGPVLREVTASATAAFFFQVVFIVSFSYVLFFWLVRHYPVTGLSSFTLLTPIFGVICGALLLNEPISLNIFLALALIVLGLYVVNRPARRRIPPG